MEEKLERVTLWLKKIYENQPVPEYEVNERTVDILYEVMEYNEASDRDVSLLMEDMEKKATEYEAEANYLQGILTDSLDIYPHSLSSEGTSSLNVLVDCAMALETKDTSLSSFFCAINEMTLELYATESKNRELEVELTDMNKELTAVLMMENLLEQEVKKTENLLEAEKIKDDSECQSLLFLNKKYQDLKIRVKDVEEQLGAIGFNNLVTHEALISLSKKLAGLQEEIVPLDKKLEDYLDLPPSYSLAQVKFEEVKQELDALEAQFSNEISMLSLEMPQLTNPDLP